MEILLNIFMALAGVSALVFTMGWTWIKYQKFQLGKPERWHKKLFLILFIVMICLLAITMIIGLVAQSQGLIGQTPNS